MAMIVQPLYTDDPSTFMLSLPAYTIKYMHNIPYIGMYRYIQTNSSVYGYGGDIDIVS